MKVASPAEATICAAAQGNIYASSTCVPLFVDKLQGMRPANPRILDCQNERR